MTQTRTEKPQLTAVQQAALDKVLALLAIEAETGTITKRARSSVMQGLDPADLAAIAPEIVRFKQSQPAPRKKENENDYTNYHR